MISPFFLERNVVQGMLRSNVNNSQKIVFLVSCSSFLLFRDLADFRHRFGKFLCSTHCLFCL